VSIGGAGWGLGERTRRRPGSRPNTFTGVFASFRIDAGVRSGERRLKVHRAQAQCLALNNDKGSDCIPSWIARGLQFQTRFRSDRDADKSGDQS